MAKFNPPGELDFDKVTKESWEAWSSRWDRYRAVTKLSEAGESEQVDALIYSMGAEAENIFRGFLLDAEDRKSYEKVLAAFRNYFAPQTNVIFERAQFHRRLQHEGEPAELFVRAVRNMADSCNFVDKSDQIRDRLVVGIRNLTLSKEMQRMSEKDLSEGEAIRLIRQSEAVDLQMKLLQQARATPTSTTESQEASADFVRAQGRPKFSKTRDKRQSESCSNCGFDVHVSGGCPAANLKCNGCGKMGHFVRKCRAKQDRPKQRAPHRVDCSESSCSQEHSTDSLMDSVYLSEVVDTPKGWFSDVCMDGVKVRFKLDTGAEVSVVPEGIAPSPLKRACKRLVGPGNTPLTVVGSFDSLLSTDACMHVETLYVVKGQQHALLSRDACVKLRLLSLKVDAMYTGVSHIRPNAHIESFTEEFPTLFSGLGKIIGSDYHIRLDSTVSPFSVYVPRRVPYPLKPKVKSTLEQMVSQGVIFPVDRPTDWCAPIVVVPKDPDCNKVRICVDYTELNKGVLREVYPVSEVEDTLANIGGGTVFSKLDANSGFFQIPLTEESKLLTTFLTDEGRFAFHRLPFGLSSCPEVFTKVLSRILAGLEGVVCHMDDMCVFGGTQVEHDVRLRKVLARLAEAGVTLNPSKCSFSQKSVKFLGHVVSDRGFEADPERIQGILDYPKPQHKKGLMTFMGMINGLGKFTTRLSTLTAPLRGLLVKEVDWCWGLSQDRAFDEVKRELTCTPCLAPYQVSLETIIETDASRVGLGAALFQIQEDGSKRLVCAASRALTGTEQRYAVIELEGLCVKWACEKFRVYIMGKKVTIRTDHKPLVPLLNDCPLDKLPLRVQRFRLALLPYTYVVVHVPGKENVVADALSRSGVGPQGNRVDNVFSEEVEEFVREVVDFRATPQRLIQIQQAQKEDEVCSLVMRHVQDGWPQFMSSTESLLLPYFEARAHLSFAEGVLVYDRRIVIPRAERLRTLSSIHEGHLGISKCRDRARESVWWPGMSKAIGEMVQCCPVCQRHKPKVTEPLLPSIFPSRPWERLGSDLFYLKGKWYLIVVDYYSRYVEYALLTGLSCEAIVEVFKAIFARHGVPEVLVSDNGPQYVGKAFVDFSRQYGFTHVTSSPKHAQCNGAAERAVQTVKRLLTKSLDPHLAILSYRTSPLGNGLSPAELLMGRKLRTTVPALQCILHPRQHDGSAVAQWEKDNRTLQKGNYDRRHGARELPALSKDEVVWVKDLSRYAKVLQSVVGSPRSYLIESGGAPLRRNRNLLVATTTNPLQDTGERVESPTAVTQDSPPLQQLSRITPTSPPRYPSSPTMCNTADRPTHLPNMKGTSRCGRRIIPVDKLNL